MFNETLYFPADFDSKQPLFVMALNRPKFIFACTNTRRYPYKYYTPFS